MKKFFKVNSAVTAIEYGLITAAVVLLIVGALYSIGTGANNVFSGTDTAFQNASLSGYTGPGYGIAPPGPGNLHYGSGSGVTVSSYNVYGCHPINSPTSAIFSGNQLYSVKMSCDNAGIDGGLAVTAYKDGFIAQSQSGQIPQDFDGICISNGAQDVGEPFGGVGDPGLGHPLEGAASIVGNKYICNYN